MEPQGPGQGPGREEGLDEADQLLASLGRSQSRGNRYRSCREEELGAGLQDPEKEEEVKTLPLIGAQSGVPVGLEPRNHEQSPAASAGGPMGPAHVGPSQSAPMESGTETEPELALDWEEETLSRRGCGHVTRHRDKGMGAEAPDETSPWWSEREVRKVSRRVLSVLRRALEAGLPEPEGEELGDQAVRGQGPSDQASADNRIPRKTLPTEGEETTHQGTRGTHGTHGKR